MVRFCTFRAGHSHQTFSWEGWVPPGKIHPPTPSVRGRSRPGRRLCLGIGALMPKGHVSCYRPLSPSRFSHNCTKLLHAAHPRLLRDAPACRASELISSRLMRDAPARRASELVSSRLMSDAPARRTSELISSRLLLVNYIHCIYCCNVSCFRLVV